MIGCLPTRVRKQPIIALYFELETILKFYNLEARTDILLYFIMVQIVGKGYQQMKKLMLEGRKSSLKVASATTVGPTMSDSDVLFVYNC